MGIAPTTESIRSFDDFMSYTNKMFGLDTHQKDLDLTDKEDAVSSSVSVTSEDSSVSADFDKLEQSKLQRKQRKWSKIEDVSLSQCKTMDDLKTFARERIRTITSVQTRHRRLVAAGKAEKVQCSIARNRWLENDLKKLAECSTFKEVKEFSLSSQHTYEACKKKRIELCKKNPSIPLIVDNSRNTRGQPSLWSPEETAALLSCRTIDELRKMASRLNLPYGTCKNKFYAAVKAGEIIRLDQKKVERAWSDEEVRMLLQCNNTSQLRKLHSKQSNGRTIGAWYSKFYELGPERESRRDKSKGKNKK